MRNKCFFLILILALSLFCTGCAPSGQGNRSAACEYESRLFRTDRVHTVEVTLAEADWADLNARPMEKIKYAADVSIDGETFSHVSFATKGNSSLAAVAADPESCRYSFKINFGKFEKEQTYYGLNKLHLNNMFGDATLMKDFVSYELFRRAGVSAPLVSYVWLTVNGSPVGLYIAVEDVSESFRARALNNEGELYKPEPDMVDNADAQLAVMQEQDAPAEQPAEAAADGSPSSGLSAVACRGADLIYIDDDPASYPDIFDHAQTKASEEAMQRVVNALRGFAERRNPEEYLDINEIFRYFAAHNFVLSGDSYTGLVPTNYILYERSGKLAMLPWDYNLAFGGFPVGAPDAAAAGAPGEIFEMPGDAQNVMPEGPSPEEISILINTGIHSPLTGLPDEARPVWAWILTNDYFRLQYGEALRSLVSGYFESGKFDAQADALYQMLLPYVEKDPTAFYTAEEFTLGYQMFKDFCRLRAQSIRAQLDGKLSPITFNQNAEDRIDASGLDMAALGTPLHDTPVAQ